MPSRKRFGEILIEAGILTEETLEEALFRQQESGQRLGLVLEEMGVLSDRAIALVVSRQFNLKTVSNIAKHKFPPETLSLVDVDTALGKFIFPLKTVGQNLHLAMSNPLDLATIDALAFQTGLTIVPYVTTVSEIQAAIRAHYLKINRTKAADWWSILVVEDDKLLRSSIVDFLKKTGYETFEADNGLSGLKVAIQKKPHLVLADIIMPRMDGFEMFRGLQATPETKHIPVVGISARSAPEEETKLLDAGFFDFIAKPVNVVRLQGRLKRAIRHNYRQEPSPLKWLDFSLF